MRRHDDRHPGSSWASCTVRASPWSPGQTVQDHMSATSGESCEHSLSAGGRTLLVGARISRPPKFGTAVAQGVSRVVYKSKPGYVGQDSFTYTISTKSGSADLVFNVDVAQ